MIGKKISVAVAFTVVIINSYAQEFGIELDGGLQGMHYALQNGKTKLLPGGSFGLNYAFKLGPQWGLLTGISGGLYRTQATLQDGQPFSYNEVDDAGSAFKYNLRFKGYKETQQFLAASIPLLLQYHTSISSGSQLYFNGGGKIFIPFNTKVQISAQQLSLSGYYPDYNIEVSNLPQHGFGTLNSWKGSATADLKPAAAVSAAAGIIFPISRTTRLYTGLYIDYGLTDLNQKVDSMPLATYSSSNINEVKTNSVLNMETAGPAKLLSFGLQVRLSFGYIGSKSSKGKPTSKPKAKEEIQKPVTTVNKPTANEQPPKPKVPVDKPKTNATTSPPAITRAIPTLSPNELKIMQSPVVFGWIGETTISPAEKTHLDAVASLLKKYPRTRISVVGHFCSTKTETEKKKIGLERAKAVQRYLQDKGISRKRIDVSVAHFSDPDLPDPNFNYRNRRADISVKGYSSALFTH